TAVVRALSRDKRLNGYTLLPLSGGQLIGVDDRLTSGGGGDERERRATPTHGYKATQHGAMHAFVSLKRYRLPFAGTCSRDRRPRVSVRLARGPRVRARRIGRSGSGRGRTRRRRVRRRSRRDLSPRLASGRDGCAKR